MTGRLRQKMTGRVAVVILVTALALLTALSLITGAIQRTQNQQRVMDVARITEQQQNTLVSLCRSNLILADLVDQSALFLRATSPQSRILSETLQLYRGYEDELRNGRACQRVLNK